MIAPVHLSHFVYGPKVDFNKGFPPPDAHFWQEQLHAVSSVRCACVCLSEHGGTTWLSLSDWTQLPQRDDAELMSGRGSERVLNTIIRSDTRAILSKGRILTGLHIKAEKKQ